MSKKDYFKIKINKRELYIDITFQWKNTTNIENLFIIIKHYVDNLNFLIYNTYVIASNSELAKNDDNVVIFRNIKLIKLKKINFIDFMILYDEMLESDTEKYLNNYDFYGFRFFFLSESKIWEDKDLFPKYPWNEKIKEKYFFYRKYENKIENLNNKIKKLEKKNLLLIRNKYRFIRWLK